MSQTNKRLRRTNVSDEQMSQTNKCLRRTNVSDEQMSDEQVSQTNKCLTNKCPTNKRLRTSVLIPRLRKSARAELGA